MPDSVCSGDTLDNPSYVDDAFRGAKALTCWLVPRGTKESAIVAIAASAKK